MHGLERAARGRGDHRPSRGLGLDRGDPELLDGGQDQRPGVRVQLDELLIVDATEKLDLAAVRLTEALELRPGADDLEALAGVAGRLGCDLDPLVRNQLGDRQEVVVGLSRAETLYLNWRVNNGRITPVNLVDPALGLPRVRHVPRDSAGRLEVPAADRREHQVEDRSHRPGHLRYRPVALEPRISERTVAIADVDGRGRRSHAVREGAAARHDHRVVVHGKPFGREREQRQKLAEAALPRTGPLQRRGRHRVAVEPALGSLPVVQQRVHRRVGQMSAMAANVRSAPRRTRR